MSDSGPTELDATRPPTAIFEQLPRPVQELVLTAQVLYAGHWDDFAEDVRRRKEGRPYLFKVDFDLDDVPGWIQRLRDYENARGERFPYTLSA
jgi:hypothetical protein